MHEGLLKFLKQVGYSFRAFNLCWLQKTFIFVSFTSTLKSPISKTFSYFLLYTSNAFSICSRWVETLILLGLYEQHSSHLQVFTFISVKKASISLGNTWSVSKIASILFQTYNNIPPLCLLRSNLNGVLKPSI